MVNIRPDLTGFFVSGRGSGDDVFLTLIPRFAEGYRRTFDLVIEECNEDGEDWKDYESIFGARSIDDYDCDLRLTYLGRYGTCCFRSASYSKGVLKVRLSYAVGQYHGEVIHNGISRDLLPSPHLDNLIKQAEINFSGTDVAYVLRMFNECVEEVNKFSRS